MAKAFISSSINKLRLLNFALSFALVGMIALIVSQAAVPAGYIGYYETDVVDRVNAARVRNDMGRLQHIECLNTVAQRWSKKMADINQMIHSTYYPSTSNPSMPVGEQIKSTCGGTWSSYGENIAAGYSTSSSVYNAWMASTTHKANILRPKFTKTGVGSYRDANGKVWWTQVFASCSSCTSAWGTAASVGGAWPMISVSEYSRDTGVKVADMTTYNYQTQVMDNEDVYFIKRKGTASGFVELNRLTAASEHKTWTGAKVTNLTLADITKYNPELQFADNGDLYVIRKQNTASGFVEVGMLTAASGYKTWGSDKVTIIPVADVVKYSARFQVGYAGNLYFYKRGGTSDGKLHIDRLDVASNFTTWGYQKVSGVSTSSVSGFNYTMRVLRNGDFGMVRMQNTTSDRIEFGRLNTTLTSWDYQAYTALSTAFAATSKSSVTPLQDGSLVIIAQPTATGNVRVQHLTM